MSGSCTGPSFSIASCGFSRKPGIRYVSRPSLRTARSICTVASSTLGAASSLGLRRASPGQKSAIFDLWLIGSPDLVAAAGDVFLGVDPGGEDDFARRLLAGEDLEGELDRVRTARGVEEGRVEDALLDVLDALVRQGVDADEAHPVVALTEAPGLLRGEP